VGLAVGKCTDRGLADLHPDVIANALGQRAVGRTAKYFHLRLKREHKRTQDYAWRGTVCNTAPPDSAKKRRRQLPSPPPNTAMLACETRCRSSADYDVATNVAWQKPPQKNR